MENRYDRLIWQHSTLGELSLQNVYSFMHTTLQPKEWSKYIWNIFIPPSDSTLAWIIIQGKCLQVISCPVEAATFPQCVLYATNLKILICTCLCHVISPRIFGIGFKTSSNTQLTLPHSPKL